MTKEEARAYLEGLTPTMRYVIVLDETQWTDFRTSVLEMLGDPALDPKYREALENIGTLVATALGGS